MRIWDFIKRLLWSERPRSEPGTPPPEKPPREEVDDQASSHSTEPLAVRQRAQLIEVCIEVSEQVDSRMLREQLSDALSEVGVVPYDPSGERFDPKHHESVGRLSTDDPELDGLVGAVQRPGYREGTVTVRFPEVLVWRHEHGQAP